MAWRRPGDKPLSEAMMVSLLTHICITRPQWVNGRAATQWPCLSLIAGLWHQWDDNYQPPSLSLSPSPSLSPSGMPQWVTHWEQTKWPPEYIFDLFAFDWTNTISGHPHYDIWFHCSVLVSDSAEQAVFPICFHSACVCQCWACTISYQLKCHDDVTKWKHFLRYWPFVRGIHWWIPLNKASDAELWCFLWSAPE